MAPRPTTNPAWTIPSTASKVQDLTKVDKAVPTPGPNQVLVRLTAASLNYRDYLIATRNPQYPGDHVADLVPGSDGAGVIHTAGSSSSWRGREGTLVVIHPCAWLDGDVTQLDQSRILGGRAVDGTLQSWLLVDDGYPIPAPKNLTAEEAACLFTAGSTAWAAIRGGLDGRLDGQGQTVLTQGTGGVSCFAIQIAAALGATVIATSSSDAKLDLAKSLGATHLINYKTTPAWDAEVLRLTSGAGVDHVIEVGGAATLMQSLMSTRTGGLVSIIGVLSANEPISEAFVPSMLFGAKTVKGRTAFSARDSTELCRFVEAHGIKPVVAETFGFEEAVRAFEVLEGQKAVGKIVVRIGEA
ncbi:hypothetical protein BDV95DRAFT_490055 [Massariosphaeria phaeospora]|uniref:Enoyl reductase (ER) domain-containing protein n=1 Tax=Massariosphaeria phaeospora TaxID=100035 RepID=A0A7C8ME02_9PLEO|nr:hypothetical protein BDV95DRAFT_490055 [Massariosphaeria phaeospora]